MNTENIQAQMRKGVLEYCIMLILSKRKAYVNEIISDLKKSRLIVVEGTLYPLLTRLKNANYLTYDWAESTQGPPRKYYEITPEGIKLLSEMDISWKDLQESVDTLKKNLE